MYRICKEIKMNLNLFIFKECTACTFLSVYILYDFINKSIFAPDFKMRCRV